MNQIGHGKIFAATYTGSMYGQRDILTLWPYVIANANADHTVELNPSVISSSLGWATSEVEAAINKLCSPDPNSRSKEHEGRRLLPRGGFMYLVVTHEKYGFIKNEDERKAYFAQKQRESRENRKASNGTNGEAEKKEVPEPDPNVIETSRIVSMASVQIMDERTAIDQCAVKAVDPGFAKYVYGDWRSRGGKDAGGVPVEWIDYICKRWEREREQWMDGTHHFKVRRNGQASNNGGTGVSLGMRLKAVEEQLSMCAANPTSTFYKPNPTELERSAYQQLKRTREEISRQIANGAVNTNTK